MSAEKDSPTAAEELQRAREMRDNVLKRSHAPSLHYLATWMMAVAFDNHGKDGSWFEHVIQFSHTARLVTGARKMSETEGKALVAQQGANQAAVHMIAEAAELIWSTRQEGGFSA